MVYVPFQKNGIDNEKSQHGWQLRVHVAAEAIDTNSENNKINLIEQCLRTVFGQDQVDLKIYQIANSMDKDGYDGALSPTGKDRTQIGKEICIIMPDAEIEQLKSDQYKRKLLHLWQLFQKNNVPLLHLNLPGDQSITISDSHVPSPFSFTSHNPFREEWKVEHGILFKKFEAHGNHPILEVNFSIVDINKYGISLEQSLTQSTTFLAQHRQQVQDKIAQQLQHIKHQESYSTFLKDDKIKDSLKLLVAEYKKMEKYTALDERGNAQVAFSEALKVNEEFQRLVKAYPHESDRDFSENCLIGEIEAGIKGRLTDKRIDEIVDQLKNKYEEKVAGILQDFQKNNIAFEDYDIRQLIDKNPAAMQSVFRQQALISQESEQNDLINGDKVKLIVALLNSYKTERNQKTQGQYFSMFGALSRPFGAWSKSNKFAAVDALLEALNPDQPQTYLDKKHLGPLQQGNLGSLINKLGLDLNSILQPNEKSSLLPN